MTVKNEKVLLSASEALLMLPKKKMIHTFTTSFGVLHGARIEREELVQRIKEAPERRLSGPNMTNCGHGFAIANGDRYLFIETKKNTVKNAQN